jgi:transposase
MTDSQFLIDENTKLKEKVILLQKENDFLREKFKLAQHRQFGASSEKSPDQTDWLFNEAETTVDAAEPESDTAVTTAATETDLESTVTSTKKKTGRKPLPADLPRETHLIDLSDAEKICPCCNGDLHKIGEEKSEQLAFIPASLKVIETLRPKYACRACEKNNTATPIVIAPMPASPIPKSMATPSLLAYIIGNKYQLALPLYRQEIVFKQLNIDLNRNTMSNWIMRSADVLEKLLQRVKITLLTQTAIHADETPVTVLQDEKNTHYMWVYCSGRDSPDPNSPANNIVIYDYQPSREGACPKRFLGDYKGYLQVDGYAAYASTHATLVGCMAHARRKFIDAQKIQPKGKIGRADWAIAQIKKLYIIEAQISKKTPEEKYALRQLHSLPLLSEFKVWLDKSAQQTNPKSTIGEAVSYTLRQWGKLITYTQHGQLCIDNNRAERAVKPFVIGRKNWLFSNTASGARASAILYSIIETAKANGLNPVKYVDHLLTEIPKRNADDVLEDLMPWVVRLGGDD